MPSLIFPSVNRPKRADNNNPVMKNSLLLALALLFCVSLSANPTVPGDGNTLTVSSTQEGQDVYRTLQDAIDAAADSGDTIEIAADFNQNETSLDFKNKSINLVYLGSTEENTVPVN